VELLCVQKDAVEKPGGRGGRSGGRILFIYGLTREENIPIVNALLRGDQQVDPCRTRRRLIQLMRSKNRPTQTRLKKAVEAMLNNVSKSISAAPVRISRPPGPVAMSSFADSFILMDGPGEFQAGLYVAVSAGQGRTYNFHRFPPSSTAVGKSVKPTYDGQGKAQAAHRKGVT
jgi:hypothetical protein